MPDTPFESIESAQRYVGLLREAVEDAHEEIRADVTAAAAASPGRHLDALRVVDHKLAELEKQLRTTARILNDLRMLRRILEGAEVDE